MLVFSFFLWYIWCHHTPLIDCSYLHIESHNMLGVIPYSWVNNTVREREREREPVDQLLRTPHPQLYVTIMIQICFYRDRLNCRLSWTHSKYTHTHTHTHTQHTHTHSYIHIFSALVINVNHCMGIAELQGVSCSRHHRCSSVVIRFWEKEIKHLKSIY